MKEVGLLINLYQSTTREEGSIRQEISDFYSPLIKLLKSSKNVKVSLNIPLSTFEVLDKFGYSDLISDIKDLYENERVEIVSSAPYSPLLTQFPQKIVEDQIILNEYGVGYYLGAKQGFEGEASIMMKDLEGFVPPLFVFNDTVLDVLDEMGYKWVAVESLGLRDFLGIKADPDGKNVKSDSIDIDEKVEEIKNDSKVPPIFGIEGRDLVLVKVTGEILDSMNEYNKDAGNRDKGFSERKKDILNIFSTVLNRLDKRLDNGSLDFDGVAIIKMGDSLGEVENIGMKFSDEGYDSSREYKDKFEAISLLFDFLTQKSISVFSVRDVLRNRPKIQIQPAIPDMYGEYLSYIVSKYYDLKNMIEDEIVNLENLMISVTEDEYIRSGNEDLSTICMWKDDFVSEINDINIRNIVGKFMMFTRFISIEKYMYVCASKINEKMDKEILGFYEVKVKDFMNYARGFAEYVDDITVSSAILDKADKILDMFDKLKS